MRPGRGYRRTAPAQRGQFRPRLVARRLTVKVYFDGGCRPNPGAISVAAVIRGSVDRRDDVAVGSSGDAEWLALLHALEVALAAGATDVILLGDSAGTIDQAQGRARKRCAHEVQLRFDQLSARFDRLRFRRIRRNQNLAGIALDHFRRRSQQ